MCNEKDEILEETVCEEVKETEKKEKKCCKKDKDNKKIEELENALKESEDKYIRMLAEYDNYKKRTQKEKESLYKDGIADSVEKIRQMDADYKSMAPERFEFIVNHEEIAPEVFVTTYANGTRVTVDYNAETVKVERASASARR